MALENVLWMFDKRCVTDLDEFENRLYLYQCSIRNNPKQWDSDEIVIPFKDVYVYYEAYDDGHMVLFGNESIAPNSPKNIPEGVIRPVGIMANITTKNRRGFTALEFFENMQNLLYIKNLGEKYFFDGLRDTNKYYNGKRVFVMRLGY